MVAAEVLEDEKKKKAEAEAAEQAIKEEMEAEEAAAAAAEQSRADAVVRAAQAEAQQLAAEKMLAALQHSCAPARCPCMRFRTCVPDHLAFAVCLQVCVFMLMYAVRQRMPPLQLLPRL